MQCGLLALSIVFLLHIARAATTTVHVGQGGGLTFTPDPVFIQPGDTVEWVWDASGHSATSGTPGQPDGIFDSGIQSVPFTFSHTFPTAASFPYFCTRHGAMGMVGTVNVAASTPTPTPAPVSISGTVIYCSNPALNPVPGVTLTLTGTMSGSTLTDGSGNYTFSGLPSGGNYTVTPTMPDRAPGSVGINGQDVLAVRRHILTLDPLTGCRLTAADVNGVFPPGGNGAINAVDVTAIQKFFLTIHRFFNVGKLQVHSFFPHSYTGIVTNQTAQNFTALVFGDVASTFIHRPEGPSQTGAGDVYTSADEVAATVAAVGLPEVAVAQSKSNFIAAVRTSAIDAKNKLVGFQGDFTFDERVVTFQSEPVQKAGITGGNWNVSGNVLPGAGPIRTLRILAYSNDFTPLSGSGTLFELRMTRVSQGAQSTPLLWAAPPNQFIFIDADLKTQKPGNAAPGSVTPSISSVGRGR